MQLGPHAAVHAEDAILAGDKGRAQLAGFARIFPLDAPNAVPGWPLKIGDQRGWSGQRETDKSLHDVARSVSPDRCSFGLSI